MGSGIRGVTFGRVCEMHALQVPLAYVRLLVARGGATGSSQQLPYEETTAVPSVRVTFGDGGERIWVSTVLENHRVWGFVEAAQCRRSFGGAADVVLVVLRRQGDREAAQRLLLFSGVGKRLWCCSWWL